MSSARHRPRRLCEPPGRGEEAINSSVRTIPALCLSIPGSRRVRSVPWIGCLRYLLVGWEGYRPSPAVQKKMIPPGKPPASGAGRVSRSQWNAGAESANARPCRRSQAQWRLCGGRTPHRRPCSLGGTHMLGICRANSMHLRLLRSSSFRTASALILVVYQSGCLGLFLRTRSRTLARSRPGSGL